MEQRSVVIRANTQEQIGDLRIGVGNVWESDYTDASGAAHRGLTAGLWISVRGDASQDRSVRVHNGQELGAGSYQLRVVDVGERSGVGFVELTVREVR